MSSTTTNVWQALSGACLVTALIVSGMLPKSAFSQSVDACMAAKKQEAISICQQILDGGSRNADVYWQLAAQHYQSGDAPTAEKVLAKALSVHPNNSKLKNLRDNIASSSEEERQLVAARQKNQGRVSQGRLKITCLTKTSAAGLDACRQYLQQTNVDGEKIERRIASLESTLGTTVAAVEPQAPTVSPEPVTNTSPSSTGSSSSSNQSRSNANRETARDIQTALNSLGFNTGTPDGLPGAKTRRAANAFYEATGLNPTSQFDSSMLSDIRNQQNLLNLANQKLAESRQLAVSNPTQALLLLNEAGATSRLFVAPTGYRANLDIKIAQLDSANETQLALQRQAERDRLAREEAERLAKLESEQQEREEAERIAQLEREQQVREENERLARLEREQQEREEAERLAKLEREQQAREEAERLAKLERDQQAREEAERLAQLEQDRLNNEANSAGQSQGNEEFVLLMRQISTLERRLADHQSSIDLQMNSIRSTVNDIFN